ncbi:isochorismate synthase [Corynebacterium freiburgense]|uniref:isochorismate synthase n=1 Tax=Corynebacterium freiburgense TaxID=556548 RepID=UPI00041E5A49|nr:isochorismate synthase [Corynebacterium freiburgense]WJZ02462.1 Isochorismate synthase DhbC [Corynebacterium freiburgense]
MCSRPLTAPDFLLSRAHGSVRTQGSVATFTDPWDASEALKRGTHSMIVGALPFDLTDPCALHVPAGIIRTKGPLEPPAHYRLQQPIEAEIISDIPPRNEHLERVRAAVETIRRTPLEKVVLARTMNVSFQDQVDPLLIAARLIDYSPDRNGFIVDLSPAGEGFDGKKLVGSSPEMLVRRIGDQITTYPLAGSAPRSGIHEDDRLVAKRLKESIKDLNEHRFVVEHIAAALQPLCSELSIPKEPEITSTAEMWHLATPIAGTLKDPRTTALDVALRLHPTPAICGTPTPIAQDLILQVEIDRGFYSGAVGWCDASGDGEFMVAIRCAETDGKFARAWAGGGIVSNSNPESELRETDAKMRTMLRALGL